MLKTKSGFTLTELMIALSLNGFLIVGLIAAFVSGLTHYNTTYSTNQLDVQLHAAMDSMVSDIRRAGYWSLSSSIIGSHANTNPFMTSSTDITIGSGNNCILVTYDHTNTGALPAISSSVDDCRYGYRLSGGAVQSRPWGAPFACNASASSWTNITDPNTVNISVLNFAQSTQVVTGAGHTITIRYVTITLTGSLVTNSTITKTLTTNVRVENDKYS